jgi:nucleotide-binding universal stress UspA family protein
MKILIPTDFSANAKHAIDYAYLSPLANTLNAEIKLLNVYTPPVTRNNLPYPLIQDQMVRAVKEAEEQLTILCNEISDNTGLRCKNLVMTGGVVEEIIKEAKGSKADMIVMGTKGASGIEKILFGSNAASVIENATCPVLVVPKGAPIALPKRIVFATNYHDSDMTTLKSLANLAKMLEAELMIVHVSKDKLKSERDLIEQFSKAVAVETGFQQPFYYVMQHADIKKGLDLFMDSSGADLLALSTRKRSVFEKLFDSSLTKQMAYQVNIPLLAFHATVSGKDSENKDF